MRLRDLYYTVKPLIPRSVQIAVRRRIASQKVKSVGHIWPIDPLAGTPPRGWKGWPEGKRFALVLSHDVDSAKGCKNVLKLADLEEELGFHSSFSFVPERYGRVSLALLDRLRRRSFDVAVHGLKHDGKLFLSRRRFNRQATRINKYLEEWKTEGFTSPSMLRNLDWMKALNIKYSISTFDTDPFEPQPGGVRAIFPFLVYGNGCQRSAFRDPQGPEQSRRAISDQLLETEDSRRKTICSRENPSSPVVPSPQNPIDSTNSINPSNPTDSTNSINSIDPINFSNPSNSRDFFVELPYTLPQDFTLFIILKEKDIGIWKHKLDWIAENGGMALLNTHPDYMNCRGGGCGGEEYPMRFFEEFLHYVREKYEGQYWHVLPKEIAWFWKEKMVMANRQIQNKSGRLGS